MFTTALDLHGQLLIWESPVAIIWPVFNDLVDMEVDENKCDRVRATLFPGIREVERSAPAGSRSYIQEGLVFPPLVLVQKGRDREVEIWNWRISEPETTA